MLTLSVQGNAWRSVARTGLSESFEYRRLSYQSKWPVQGCFIEKTPSVKMPSILTKQPAIFASSWLHVLLTLLGEFVCGWTHHDQMSASFDQSQYKSDFQHLHCQCWNLLSPLVYWLFISNIHHHPHINGLTFYFSFLQLKIICVRYDVNSRFIGHL